MLVLSRKAGESVFIGDDISVTIVRINGNQVRIKIDAPRSVPVLREELLRGNNESPFAEMMLDLPMA